MRLEFGNVVRHIVDDRKTHSFIKYTFESAAHRVGDQLTIRPGKIRSRRHCLEVSLPFRRVNGGTRELTVGQMQAVSSHRLVQLSNEVRANLMTQAARTRVDQHHDALF